MQKTLTKEYLAETINQKLGLPKSESLKLVASLFDTIAENLEKENIVKIPGFGTFKVRSKNSRIGRNPKTGVEAKITARKVVTYHVSDKIKFKLNP